jgi:hypothetical protein
MGRIMTATLVSNLALSAMAFVWLIVTSWWFQGEQYDWPLSFASLSALVAIHILPFSLPLAVLAWKLGWRSRLGHVLCGAVLGLKLGLNFFDSPVNAWITIFTYAAAGLICGWIYWRIAIRQTPEKAHAIDPA